MTRDAKDSVALSRIECFSLAQGVLNGLPVFQLRLGAIDGSRETLTRAIA